MCDGCSIAHSRQSDPKRIKRAMNELQCKLAVVHMGRRGLSVPTYNGAAYSGKRWTAELKSSTQLAVHLCRGFRQLYMLLKDALHVMSLNATISGTDAYSRLCIILTWQVLPPSVALKVTWLESRVQL